MNDKDKPVGKIFHMTTRQNASTPIVSRVARVFNTTDFILDG